MRKPNETLRAAGAVLKRNIPLTVLLAAAVAGSISLQLLPAFLLQRVIDENFANGLAAGLWKLAALYGLATSGVHFIEFIKVALTTVLGQKILVEIRSRMEKRLSRFSYDYYVHTPTGDIMSRLTTDVDAVNKLFSAGIIDVITNLFKVFGLFISLWLIAPRLVWLELVMLPAIFLPSRWFRKRMFTLQKQIRRRVSGIYTFIQEWFSGIGTVKAYSAEQTGRVRFGEHLEGLLESNLSASRYESIFPCVMQTARALCIAAALFFAAENGTPLSLGLSVGTLAAVADLIGKLFDPIEALAQEFQTVQESVAGLARIRDFFNEPPEDCPHIPQTPGASGIVLKDLSFSYGDFRVLDGLSVTVNAREKAVLIGRSGAGKTTVMNLVSGLYRPKEGTVRVCGVDPFTLPPSDRRKLIGIVPQDPQVFDGTVLDNITLKDPSLTREQAEAAAKLTGLHERILEMPSGYDTVIGEGAANLSDGEIQLLSIARAVAADPKVLLLDEPSSGMDSATEARIFEAIRRSSADRTILSVSHRLSGIIDADTVHIVADGTVVESGAPGELAAGSGWYSMYSRMEHAGWSM